MKTVLALLKKNREEIGMFLLEEGDKNLLEEGDKNGIFRQNIYACYLTHDIHLPASLTLLTSTNDFQKLHRRRFE